MTDILERLRNGICDDKCRVLDAANGCQCAEAADALDQTRRTWEAVDEANERLNDWFGRACDELIERGMTKDEIARLVGQIE